ncbi:MAG: CBS domain-containing protein [Acidimicrobiia bacterium]|nr:CBS domain-containing protein [Acidimicrobiia bacterium]
MDAVRKQPVTIDAAESIHTAAQLMDQQAVGAVIVLDGGVPVGIVTDRDLVVRGLAQATPADGRIDSVMTTELVSLDAEADLRDALPIFRSHAIRRLPLIEAGAVVGMLTVDDLLIDLTADLGDLARPITGEVIFGHAEARVPATTE